MAGVWGKSRFFEVSRRIGIAHLCRQQLEMAISLFKKNLFQNSAGVCSNSIGAAITVLFSISWPFCIFAANLVKDISRQASASVGYVIGLLTEAFLCIGSGGNVEQALIGFGVLHNTRSACGRRGDQCLAIAGPWHQVRRGLILVRSVVC
jgi:hypothetical protein